MTDNTDEPKDRTASSASVITETKLAQLARGLLLMNIQKEMDEPGYTPIDRITRNRWVVQRRQEYCSDIERVLDEAKLTINLQREVQKETKVGEKLYQPEEIISYYNGIFLEQVHQLKDKLFRMVSFLLLVPEIAQDNQKKDPKKLDYKPFLDKNKEKLTEAGIFDLLSQWGSGNLAKALDKRTSHHHRVSTLRLNEDFQKIKMSRMMLNPLTSNQLTEYGKKRMVEIGEEAYNKWRKELVDKQQEIINEIEQNIEMISEKLISHFKIPAKPAEGASIVNNYMEFLASMDIHNEANMTKIPPDLKPLIDGFLEIAENEIGGTLHLPYSAYLVGSCARGEFIPGCSDINLYFIFDADTNTNLSKSNPLVNLVFLSKKQFLSDAHKKDRFICWSDGVLLHGEGFKIDKKDFPKPGSLLCLLLNRGFIEKLEEIRTEVAALKNPDKDSLRQYSVKMVKIMLDFDFGVAMSNKPFYTASRKGKISYTKESWPNERRTNTFEQIYYKGIIRQEDFPMVIDTFLENARKNYQKLLDVETEIVKENKT